MANVRARKHGHSSHSKVSTTYQSWAHMIARCTNPKNDRYIYYGARGIKVCERWLTFDNFLADMGVRPAGMTLGRKENDGHYEPGNCAWETNAEQGNNKRSSRKITLGEETLTLAQWAARTGLKRETIAYRLNKGLSPELALAA